MTTVINISWTWFSLHNKDNRDYNPKDRRALQALTRISMIIIM